MASFSIKTKDIWINSQSPFDNDLLDREEEIKNLTNIVQNVEAPLVLAVNAPWGTGKSTFIRLWCAYLEQQNLDFIEFNAWETDFAEDPLIALISKLDKWVTNNGKSQNEKWDKFKKDILPKILKRSLITGAKVATVGVLDMEKDYEKIIADFSGDITGDLIDKFNEKSQAITQFKEVIKKVLDNLPSDQKNLIIFIDELDRCRPTYAIELLERIKHLFDIERLVFILSTDTEQLSHSICAVYGDNFDAKKYLNRFIDLDYSLKEPDLKKYIDSQFEKLLINDYYEKKKNGIIQKKILVDLTFKMANSLKLKLRDINLLATRILLILRSIQPDYPFDSPIQISFLFLKLYNEPLYREYKVNPNVAAKVIDFFIQGISDIENSDYSFDFFVDIMVYLIVFASDQEQEVIEEFKTILLSKFKHNSNVISELNNNPNMLSEKVHEFQVRFLNRYNTNGSNVIRDIIQRIDLLYRINIE